MRYTKAVPVLIALLIIPLCTAEPQPQLDWTFTASGTVNGADITSDGGLVVAATSDGYVYAINRTGDQVWNYTDDEPFSTIALTPGGTTVVAATESAVYSLDASGKFKWKKQVGNINDIAISPDGSLIVAALGSRMVYALDSAGDRVWEFPTDYAAQAVAVSSGYVAAGTSSGTIYLLDHSGNLQWETPVSSVTKLVRTMALSGSTVYAAPEGKILYRLENGKVSGQEGLLCSPVDVKASQDGFVAVGCSEGDVVLYEGLKRKWSYGGSGGALSVAPAASGSLVVEAVASNVRLISPPDLIPPVITFKSPRGGEVVSGSVTIDASFDEAIDKVIIEIDGEFAGGSVPRKWSTAAYPDGKHTISIEVTDTDGNTARGSIDVYIGEAPTQPQEGVPQTTRAPTAEDAAEDEPYLISDLPSGGAESPVVTLSPLDAIPGQGPRRSLAKSAVAIVVILIFLAIAFTSYQRRRGAGKYQWKGR